jgi:hypothetical protein
LFIMERDGYPHGTPSWVDLGTADVDAAAAFYGSLFGWTCAEGPPEAGGYRMCLLRGRPVAGLGSQSSPGPPAWSTYVTVDDVGIAAEAVSAAGGRVLAPPMDVLGFGRAARCADPLGAAFSMWQPLAHHGAGIVNEPGTLIWNELITTDVERARDFYHRVFGWAAATSGEGEAAYTEFGAGGRSVAGMARPLAAPARPAAAAPPHWMVHFAVADADRAAERAGELGGEVRRPPTDIEPGRVAVLGDDQGAVFSILAVDC